MTCGVAGFFPTLSQNEQVGDMESPHGWCLFTYTVRVRVCVCVRVFKQSARDLLITVFSQGPSGHYDLWAYCSNLLQAGLCVYVCVGVRACVRACKAKN